jgi:hypothetical protein
MLFCYCFFETTEGQDIDCHVTHFGFSVENAGVEGRRSSERKGIYRVKGLKWRKLKALSPDSLSILG